VRVIVDTNVVLDVLLARKPFVNAAVRLFGLIERGQIEGLLCATSLTTLDCLLSQSLSRAESRETLRRLMRLFEVAPVTRAVIEEALLSRIADFEDAVVEQSGRLAGADAVITRDAKDFRLSIIKALAPDELLSFLGGLNDRAEPHYRMGKRGPDDRKRTAIIRGVSEETHEDRVSKRMGRGVRAV
jgi:predicted nucleic acid-binding protein